MKAMQDTLRDLIAFQTIDGDTAANHAAIGYIEARLRACGLQPDIITHGGYQNLFVSSSGSKTPKVLLAAHVDVVPGPANLFTLREAEGRLYGRGVFDMKFAIAAYLSVVERLQGELEQYDFGLMITPDEEVGSPNGVPRLLEQGYLPTGVCVLSDGADGQNWDIETFAKGAWFAEFSTRGTRAHGSRPWNGDSAISRLLRFISELQTLFPMASRDDATINLGQIKGGEAINQVAEQASVRVDMRLPSVDELNRIHDEVLALCAKHQISQHEIMLLNPTINDFDNPYLQAFARSVKQVTGVTSRPWGTPAGTDARFFAAHGLPVIICVPPGGAHHSDDEWIDARGPEQFRDVVLDFVRGSARR